MSEEFIRPDGRGRKQLRDLKVEVGVLDRADGSARVYLGKNIAVATVFGPREMHPKHAARPDKAVVRINYRMATFSVDDYKRPFPSRREKEISKVLSEAYESVILTKNWPRSVIDIHVEIFQSDGGTRTAASIAITAALADAGIPMRDLTGGIATGIYDDQVCLDLTGHEDMKGSGDMPILYAPSIDEISLFQLDGKFTFEQFKEAFETSKEAIKDIVKTIQDAIKQKYLKIRDEYLVDEEIEEIDAAAIPDEDIPVQPPVVSSEEPAAPQPTPEVFAPIPEEPVPDIVDRNVIGKIVPERIEATAYGPPSEAPEVEEPEPSSHVPFPNIPEPSLSADVPATDEVAADSVTESVDTLPETDTPAFEETTPGGSVPRPSFTFDEPSSQDEPETVSTPPVEEETPTVTNPWYIKSGGELRPMPAPKVEEEEEEEDEETSSILRDLEYSFEEDE